MLFLILESLGPIEIILILSALSLLLAAGIIIFSASKSSNNQGGNLKKCPFCAELIQPEAIVCRFCGRDLPKI